jgi:hypothetical protein
MTRLIPALVSSLRKGQVVRYIKGGAFTQVQADAEVEEIFPDSVQIRLRSVKKNSDSNYQVNQVFNVQFAELLVFTEEPR